MLSVFWDGADAAVRGEPKRPPYHVVSTRGGPTWARGFNNYWLMGYEAVLAGATGKGD
jgi:hypothetical protein